MLNYLKTLWRPEVYHGFGRKGNFFEGWFFKLVDRTKENIFAFIPGISFGKDPHAFIQVLDGMTHYSSYIRFPIEAFAASKNKMEIQIIDNIFSSKTIHLNITDGKRQIVGKVDFGELKPWPITIASPGVMGWYAFVPLMECFHGVVSFDHPLTGTLSINGKCIQFDAGRGYIEKDWGRSFPSAYIWIQSNHFERTGVSLMASVAKIPWLKRAFRGFIIGLYIDGKFYRFTTYNGAQLNSVKVNDFQVQIQVSNKKYFLKIESLRSEGGLLNAPYHEKMVTRISETLNSRVKIDLFRRAKDGFQLIFSGEGNPAGLDVNGRLSEIIDA